ncbi:MAG: YraN family protein [Candidatus Phaeomarinobacter sp.]
MPGARHKARGNARQAAETRGRRAERIAAWLLRLKGYRILATRLRTPMGEIDLVAQRGNLVAVVEVKARATLDDAVAAVSVRQQQRLSAAAIWLPSWNGHLAGCDMRLDVIALAPGHWPRHIQNAWTAS